MQGVRVKLFCLRSKPTTLRNKLAMMQSCPCESKKPYKNCCQIYHAGAFAPNAEALMRSRYSAYVFGLESYLLQTWHESTRPKSLNLAEDKGLKWLGLSVKHTQNTSDDSAVVEFVARYKVGGKAERLHEVSQFKLVDDRWFYVDGVYR